MVPIHNGSIPHRVTETDGPGFMQHSWVSAAPECNGFLGPEVASAAALSESMP